MAAGNGNYADIEKFRSDYLFHKVAGGNVPSQKTCRQRLDALAENGWRRVLDANADDQLSRVNLTRIDVGGEKLIILDIDVSVLEDTATASVVTRFPGRRGPRRDDGGKLCAVLTHLDAGVPPPRPETASPKTFLDTLYIVVS